MVTVPDGAVVRQHDRPEVWKIESGTRRWIPDSETLGTMGGWSAVQVLPLGQTIDNPLGPMLQSVVKPFQWDDGSLISAWPAPHIYVMFGGMRRWVTSPDVMAERGYEWADVQPISSVEMNAIPEGLPDYGSGGLPQKIVVHTGSQFLGSGHYMETNASFTRATGVTSGGTTTETVTWFGGFHGAVYAVLTDNNGIPVPGGHSGLHRYGVDGRAFGTSKRFDAWSYTLSASYRDDVRQLHIFHAWAPDAFQAVLDKWVAAGASVAQLAGQVAKIAVTVGAVV